MTCFLPTDRPTVHDHPHTPLIPPITLICVHVVVAAETSTSGTQTRGEAVGGVVRRSRSGGAVGTGVDEWVGVDGVGWDVMWVL